MIKILIMVFLVLPCKVLANDFCADLDKLASAKGVILNNSDNVFKVKGVGRLQFYSAPNKKCALKGVFVIPGDRLYGYVEYKSFYSVMYLSRDGDQISGWVEKERLIDMHKGIAPDYNQDAQQKKSN
ncbi:hypothetical protein [Pantoea ananatis]|uniref:hypothetical protein n=2 Tax=Pantoea ananas TaxID=553 RepID=UPI001B30602A|nr:hypothetical protein [Pantoea ananatis]